MHKSTHRIQLIIALIGLIGVLGGTLLANWDKFFSPNQPNNDTEAPENRITPTLGHFLGSWTNQNAIIGDIVHLSINRIDDTSASMKVTYIGPGGYRNLGERSASFREGKLLSETYPLDSVRRLKITLDLAPENWTQS